MRYKLRTVTFQASESTDFSVDGPDAAMAVLKRLPLDMDRENFVVLAINARGNLVGFKAVHVGTLTACLVHPREVFRAAMALNAHAIVVAHNHPSNDPTPSVEDITLTDRLVRAGEIVGIPVVDSIVWTDSGGARSIPVGV